MDPAVVEANPAAFQAAAGRSDEAVATMRERLGRLRHIANWLNLEAAQGPVETFRPRPSASVVDVPAPGELDANMAGFPALAVNTADANDAAQGDNTDDKDFPPLSVWPQCVALRSLPSDSNNEYIVGSG